MAKKHPQKLLGMLGNQPDFNSCFQCSCPKNSRPMNLTVTVIPSTGRSLWGFPNMPVRQPVVKPHFSCFVWKTVTRPSYLNLIISLLCTDVEQPSLPFLPLCISSSHSVLAAIPFNIFLFLFWPLRSWREAQTWNFMVFQWAKWGRENESSWLLSIWSQLFSYSAWPGKIKSRWKKRCLCVQESGPCLIQHFHLLIALSLFSYFVLAFFSCSFYLTLSSIFDSILPLSFTLFTTSQPH